MIDQTTQNPFRIKSDEIAGPFLMLPLSQLERVREVLDRHAIRYWVDSFAVSVDGRPLKTVINFGRTGDAARIQAALDEAG
jgi:hypothetical protein